MATTAAERIKHARIEAKLTQPQLAELAGVDQANISRYENGKLSPNADTEYRLLSACEKVIRDRGDEPKIIAALEGQLGIIGRTNGKVIPVDTMGKSRPVEWIAADPSGRGGLMARRYVTMIAGEPGAGKSAITQTIAVALANGDDTAAGYVLPGHRMRGLILDAENVMIVDPDEEPEASLIQDRLQHFGLRSENAQQLVVAGLYGFDLFKDREALDGILAGYSAEGNPFDYVVVDSFTSVWSGSENVADHVNSVLYMLNRLAVRHNVAILVIHHTNKGGDTYRGSSAIAGAIAGVFTFGRLDEDEGDSPSARVIATVKLRIAPEPRTRVVYVGREGKIKSEPDEGM